MMTQEDDSMISPEETAKIGSLVEGRVVAVFRWGVIVDLGLSHVGLIDALYIDNHDTYEEGEIVSAYLTNFDEKMKKFWLRPPGQVPISERLRNKGF